MAGIVSPELEAMYKAQIAALGIGDEALIARFGYLSTEDAIAYVCAADLVVLPYREIYQSGVLFWAYSFGRGVLATRTGSFPEAVEEDKSGWLVEVESVEALEWALSCVLKDPEILVEAGNIPSIWPLLTTISGTSLVRPCRFTSPTGSMKVRVRRIQRAYD